MQKGREMVFKLLGTFPVKAVTDARRQMLIRKDGYSIEEVCYETEPGEVVSAYLLIPEGKGPFPGIVACHQHNDEYFIGKSEPAGFYRNGAGAFAVSLCKAGFAVICPDCLGFESRRPLEYERVANPFLDGAAYERHLFIDYLLRGSTLQAKYIFDYSRAVDILSSLPEIDASRIGAMGHSLGGQEAIWLCWYDPRVKAAVCNCGAAIIADLQCTCINHNFAMYLPSLLSYGMDMNDVISQIAPKPFALFYSADDPIFPSFSVRKLSSIVKTSYETTGAGDVFVCREFPGGHGLSSEAENAAISFLSSALLQ